METGNLINQLNLHELFSVSRYNHVMCMATFSSGFTICWDGLFKDITKCFIILLSKPQVLFFLNSDSLFSKFFFAQKADKCLCKFLVCYSFFYVVIMFYLGSLVWHIMWLENLNWIFFKFKIFHPWHVPFIHVCMFYAYTRVLFLRILFHCVPPFK